MKKVNKTKVQEDFRGNTLQEERELADLDKELRDQFKRPAKIPYTKAPTGRGETKGDVFVQRLNFEFKHDPLQELVKLAKSSKLSPELKAKINMEFLSYYIPKLKAVDTNPNQGEVISINILPPSNVTSESAQTINIGRG